ncbi:MAG: metallophosphoesterase [Afipia sp.]
MSHHDLDLVLIIPDSHRPWHHVKAYNLMLEVGAFLKPDHVLLLGDYADAYNLSGHGPRDPGMITSLTQEVDSVNKGLDELDRLFPDAKKKYIEGNHEWRLTRFIQNRAPELYGLVDWRELTKINQRPNWTWIPWTSTQLTHVGPKTSKLFARHRPLANSMKASAQRALCSMVYGDNHRIEETHFTGIKGDEHVCFSTGWLGDKRKDMVFGYVAGMAQWQLGFALAYVDRKTGYFYHQKIQILHNISCVVKGKRFKA